MDPDTKSSFLNRTHRNVGTDGSLSFLDAVVVVVVVVVGVNNVRRLVSGDLSFIVSSKTLQADGGRGRLISGSTSADESVPFSFGRRWRAGTEVEVTERRITGDVAAPNFPKRFCLQIRSNMSAAL